ncbi:MAG: COG4315 family predicted lipoprotein [Ktedonobacterales bacterium]
MRRFQGGMVLALMMLGALAAGCGSTTTGTSAGTSATSTASTANGAVIHTKTLTVNGKSVTALANSKGLTLYYFTADTSSKVVCTASCATNWPPLLSPSGAPSSTTTLPGTLSVLNGANGQQALYNGHPLYIYYKDGDAGDAYGEGIGGKWYVATPDLAKQ